MKATGIVRRVDDLGRVVIPKELRNVLDIHPETPIEIFTDDDGVVVLKKYQPGCSVCGEVTNDLKEYDRKLFCRECRVAISSL